MKNAMKVMFLSAALSVFALPVVAQSTNSAPVTGESIQDRKENQQDRIAQGIKSGQLTASETAKLENQQRAINHQVAADRAANSGRLTAGEKAQINHEQNQASRKIYNKKHNARTQPISRSRSLTPPLRRYE